MIDLDKIERIAKAAQERSPGPWKRIRAGKGEVDGTDARFDFIIDASPIPEWHQMGDLWDGNKVLETDSGYYEPKDETGVYIAALSPDVVLALVAKIRELEQRIADDAREAYVLARKLYEP